MLNSKTNKCKQIDSVNGNYGKNERFRDTFTFGDFLKLFRKIFYTDKYRKI